MSAAALASRRMSVPIVAIVGRPNVGKSTLFNRIVGGTRAVVDDQPGVTRDRNYARAGWTGREFLLVDTGGLVPDARGGAIEAQVRRQVELALDEADVIVFVVDVRDGLVEADRDVAELLRRRGRAAILAVNKVDGAKYEAGAYEFSALGIGEPLAVSAEQGRLTGELLDRIVERLPEAVEEQEEAAAIRVAVIGRPNVGKSSLVNRILGEERMIVHDVPGTTRDSIDTRFLHGEREFVLIDTAGLRRRGKDAQGPEYYSMVRTLRAVDRCDVALVLFDASEPLTVQDLKVAALPHELWRASVFVFNKWDLVEKETMTARRYEEDLRGRLPMQDYAPVVFVSALSGQRVARIPEMIEAVHAEASKRISTGVLNGFIRTAVADNPPPYSGSGKPARIYYATQVSASPPTIILFASHPEVLGEGYLRYLTRRMREEFGFMGTPVRIRVRKPR